MKNIANNFKKYKFVYLFLLLSLIIVLSFRQTLSFLTDEKSTKELKTISSNLEVLFEHRSNTVNLASALPMSDSEGMSQVGYTFDVKNAGDVVLKYRVLLELDSSITNQLDNNKIKYSYNINNGPYSEIKKLDDSLIVIKENTIINILFFNMFDNKFNLSVLALNALNIPIKINMAKYAVIKCLLSGRIISLNIGNFKNNIHNKAEYNELQMICEYIYLLITGSFIFLGLSSI